MSTINDGGPAFPSAVCGCAKTQFGWTGMTLRDWFAGQALAVMTAAPDYSKGPGNDAAIAARAYIIADEMLKAREVKP